MRERRKLISARLHEIAQNFPPENPPTLVAVTKKRPLEDIEEAYRVGHRDFGENRVDELHHKAELLQEKGLRDIRWHFIGHLQSKKLKQLFKVPGLSHLHSVDSLNLLEKIYARASLLSAPLYFFLQVNTSGEREKSGFTSKEELQKGVDFIMAQKRDSPLHFHGPMTLSKIRTDDFATEALKCFQKLREMRDFLQQHFGLSDLKLSMGMSADYLLAIQEGTNYIRLGRAIFGPEE